MGKAWRNKAKGITQGTVYTGPVRAPVKVYILGFCMDYMSLLYFAALMSHMGVSPQLLIVVTVIIRSLRSAYWCDCCTGACLRSLLYDDISSTSATVTGLLTGIKLYSRNLPFRSVIKL